jgi:hypothetical protein
MNNQKKSKMVPLGSAGMRASPRPMVKKEPGGKKKARPSRAKISEMSPLQLSMYKKMLSRPAKSKAMTSATKPPMRGMQYPIKDSAQKAFSRNDF